MARFRYRAIVPAAVSAMLITFAILRIRFFVRTNWPKFICIVARCHGVLYQVVLIEKYISDLFDWNIYITNTRNTIIMVNLNLRYWILFRDDGQNVNRLYSDSFILGICNSCVFVEQTRKGFSKHVNTNNVGRCGGKDTEVEVAAERSMSWQ